MQIDGKSNQKVRKKVFKALPSRISLQMVEIWTWEVIIRKTPYFVRGSPIKNRKNIKIILIQDFDEKKSGGIEPPTF